MSAARAIPSSRLDALDDLPADETAPSDAITEADVKARNKFASTSSLAAPFFDPSISPGTVIPLPPTIWTGLVILGALTAASAVRSRRR